MCGSRKFCQRGPNLIHDMFLGFFSDEGERIQIPLKVCHLNVVSLVGPYYCSNIESWLGRFVIFQGIWTILTYFLLGNPIAL